MKLSPIYLFALLISVFISTQSCNDELNTVEGWKDIPVVYGFLSLNDTATYLRVEKAFVDPQKSAYDVAQIPDSLYYKDVTVQLVRVKNNERFTLTRVEGNTEGYVRNTGIFAKAPNYLYKIKNTTLNLKSDEEWRIELLRKGETKAFAQSSTKVVGDYEVTNPATTPVFLRYDNTFNITVQTDELSARLFDVKVIFNYDEIDAATPNKTVTKNVTWGFASGTTRKSSGSTPDPIATFSRKGQDFYEFLGNSIPVVAGVKRTFKSIDIEVYSGGQELINYITIGIANTGITGSQTIPTYTNITNGLGIFTSRNRTIKKDVKLSDAAIDLLINGEFTRKLNFK